MSFLGDDEALPTMELRRLGTTGVRVSALCLGAMTFGSEATASDSEAILDTFVAAGGNFVDTANTYARGASEEILGNAMAARPGLRDQLVLATKFSRPVGTGPNDLGASRRHLRQALEQSLRRLRTDWIDLYQLHGWDPLTPLPELLSTLDDLVRAGMVRYIGVSNMAGWQIAKALGLSALHRWEPIACVQPQYSLLERGAERELLPLCAEEGLAVIAWSPLAGGVLTGKYSSQAPVAGTRGADRTPQAGIVQMHSGDARKDAIVATVASVAKEVGHSPAEVALNWVLNRPGITAPIAGVRTVEQLTSNLRACDWRLPAELEQRLDSVSAIEPGHPYDSMARFAELREQQDAKR